MPRSSTSKPGGSIETVRAWDDELLSTGLAIHEARQGFLESYSPLFQHFISKFPIGNLDATGISFDYQPGFDPTIGLKLSLEGHFRQDVALGFTTQGPHRADLVVRIKDVPAKTWLSRGQLKLFIAMMLLARAEWFFRQRSHHCVLLIDDLSSELDQDASLKLLQGLQSLGAQVVATAIDREMLVSVAGEAVKMFHVEHGVIRG